MKKFLPVLFIFMAACAQAQQKKDPIQYGHSISISPLALADFDNTLMLSGEHRFKPNLGFLLDAGLVVTSQFYENKKSALGFNIRPSIRLYYDRRLGSYGQLQAFWKRVDYHMNDWLDKDVVNGVATYFKEQDFTLRKNVYGANMIAGELFPLNSKLLLDLYAGLGVRLRKQNIVGEPNSTYRSGWVLFSNPNSDKVTTISLPFGIRLTYKLD